ncbi:MAG: class I SAM-dependent methyltransferase [Chloroflexi bacterium]|nr:MAG: class I SAM-dependent methyltransferase [Chloroflexota bacterium]
MFKKLYKLFVPEMIRNQIYMAHYDQIMQELESGGVVPENSTSDAILSEKHNVELSEAHIANLKVLTNREKLLEYMPEGSVVAEIGVFKGDFSDAILSITKPRKLHLIDPWDQIDETFLEYADFVQDRFKKEISNGQVVINKGFSFSELKHFDDHYFDWVYIDSDHSYQSTMQELELCKHKVKEGGIIAGHDYCSWSFHERMRYGVIEAVNEFCEKYDWEMIYLTNEVHRYLSFAIRQCN